MGNSIIRSKRTSNARQRNMLMDYAIDEMDMAFCDLVVSGWDEKLAAFYAYGLNNDNDATIGTFIRNQKQRHPGILGYIQHAQELRQAEANEYQRKAAELMSRMPTEVLSPRVEYDLTTKQGMLDYLIDMSKTPGLDVKTRADLSKQISDLMQFKKEEIKEEDNRINFYVPVTCKYCSLLQDAQKRLRNAARKEE